MILQKGNEREATAPFLDLPGLLDLGRGVLRMESQGASDQGPVFRSPPFCFLPPDVTLVSRA